MRPVLVSILLVASAAHAQSVDRRYAEEPTGGIAMPMTPLAGEHDARAVTYNPGGLALVRGAEAAVALTVEDLDVASSAGQGFGIYFANTVGGGILPKLGLGLGLEWLRPPRTRLAPDPGQPFRFTLADGFALGRNAGFGIAWHHFLGDGALHGVDTFDLGLSGRLGNHLAMGATLRDLDTGPIANTPVQRRYELELLARPLATDQLEVTLGGGIGETRGDVDGWARVGWRVTDGLTVIGQIDSRALHALESSPMGMRDFDTRDLRATLGIELQLGNIGFGVAGSGLRDENGGRHALGGTFVARFSAVPPPSVLPMPEHIERVEISGSFGARELTAIVARLRAARLDPTVKAVVVVFDGASAGWAALQEVRDELLAVRQTGRKVFAYMVSGTGRDYFVASAANKIYLDPAGGLRLVGMSSNTFFFKGAFDLVGVLPQFEKIAEYKSAPEQFTETGPTPIAARMHEELLDSVWTQWVKAIADGRHLSADEVKNIVDAGPYTAGELAVDAKLIDGVAAPEKVAQLITTELGGAYGVGASPIDRPERWSRPGIAIVYVEGDIVDGKSRSVPLIGQNLAGGETLIEAIQTARADPRVGAIILRIDSPGGSALASELIAREVFATRGVKPIICSMSNLAASGGYFVAAGCDAIFAEPMTITGSIGIFYGKFDLSGLLKKVGVSVVTTKHGIHADLESLYRPYTDDERTAMLAKLRYSYTRFVDAVAEGRKLDKGAVDAAGRGHVYTGEQAQPLRLVDSFGGLSAAIDEAERRMGVAAGTRVELFEYPNVPPTVLGYLGKLIGISRAEAATTLDLPGVRDVLRSVPASVLVAPEAAQMRLPFDVGND